MRIIIVYTEIQEEDDDSFTAKTEKIILQSTVPFNHFRKSYCFKILFPETITGNWKKEFRHTPKVPFFRLIKEIGGFLENAIARIKK